MSAPGHRQSPFPIVMRGYDRDQVTDHLRRLEAELRMMAADRDSAHASADELQAHLDDARHRIRELQDEVNTLSVPPTTVAGMTERVSRMLQLATDEASEVRANAKDEADETLSVARQEAEDIRASAAAAATRTKELAQEHADAKITEAEERAAEIDEAAREREAQSKRDLEAARERAREIIAAAEEDAARLRGAAHNVAMNRLARSRELAESAHDAHKQILDHLDALREHITNLPGALELSDEERDLVSLTETDDLELLNRTLLGRDRFTPQDDASTTPAEKTDVLDAVDAEYDDDHGDERYGGPARKEDSPKGDQVTA
ncbi:hypothetical protein ACK8HH_06545 [Gordonia sp. LUNF6]|uniref:hypothetical protein n=1 Tax=Gordonia TaxID=2053 RepID=UPI000782044C|nr:MULTISPECIES: hypothetical protein [Gordonia]KXT55859.1 hypothetical protein Y710_16680 [Gordonia sp. QH-12]KXT55912.1 hypothetical protein Y710_16965 [Gordonia sp. QH-12]WFN94096.1 hypothetical protein P5P27_05975 [Gordonia sihwensis]